MSGTAGDYEPSPADQMHVWGNGGGFMGKDIRNVILFRRRMKAYWKWLIFQTCVPTCATGSLLNHMHCKDTSQYRVPALLSKSGVVSHL